MSSLLWRLCLSSYEQTVSSDIRLFSTWWGFCSIDSNSLSSERKGMKGTRTCIAPIVITTSKRSDVDHTELPANTPHLPSLEGDTAQFHPAIAIPIHYSVSFPVPLRVGGWVGLVGWPIADVLPTKWSHVNHGSGVDQGKSAGYRPMS